MSINVTVCGNPLKICKRKYLLTDLERERKEELIRRRIQRLRQVREQSKIIADHLRKRFREEKQRLQELQEQQQNAQQKRRLAAELEELRSKYQECLGDIGMGHREAQLQPDPEAVLAAERKRQRAAAILRGQAAAEQLWEEENRTRKEQQQVQRQREFLRAIEDFRSSMIASLPTKKPLGRSPKKSGGIGRRRRTPLIRSRTRSCEAEEVVPTCIPPLEGLPFSDSFEQPNTRPRSLSQSEPAAVSPDVHIVGSDGEEQQEPKTSDPGSVDSWDVGTTTSDKTRSSTDDDGRLLKRSWIKAKVDELRAAKFRPESQSERRTVESSNDGSSSTQPHLRTDVRLDQDSSSTNGEPSSKTSERWRMGQSTEHSSYDSDNEQGTIKGRVEEVSLSDSEASRPISVRIHPLFEAPRAQETSKSQKTSAEKEDRDLVDRLIPSLKAFRELIARSQHEFSKDIPASPRQVHNVPDLESQPCPRRCESVVKFNPVVSYSTSPVSVDDEDKPPPVETKDASLQIPSTHSLTPILRSSSRCSTARSCCLYNKDNSDEVRFYDHDNRFEKTYRPTELVEKVDCSGLPNAHQSAEVETTLTETLSGQATSGAPRVETFGHTALFRERVRRDYKHLFGRLAELAKEERKIRASWTTSMPTDVHQSDERRRQKTCRRQKNMDTAFEKIYHKEVEQKMLSTDAGSLPPTGVPTPPPKLNVAQWAPAEPPPATSVDASPAGSIILAPPPSPRHVRVLEHLMERVHTQRLLLQEANQQKRCTQHPAELEKDLLHESTSSSGSTVSCPEFRQQPDTATAPSTRQRSRTVTERPHKHHHHHHKARHKHQTDASSTAQHVDTQPPVVEDLPLVTEVLNKAKKVREESLCLKEVSQPDDLHPEPTAENGHEVVSVSMSRLEQSFISTDSNSGHTNSSVTTYEGVEIRVSVLGRGPVKEDVQVKKLKHLHPCKKKKTPEKRAEEVKKMVDASTSPGVMEADKPKETKKKASSSRDVGISPIKATAASKEVRKKKEKSKKPPKMVASAAVQTVASTECQTDRRGQNWGEALGPHEVSTSTAYISPPDEVSIGTLDVDSVVSLLNRRRMPNESFEANPKLMQYIARLLSMSRQSVSDLNVSSSDVSSFTTDIVEEPSNKKAPTKDKQQEGEKVCSKLHRHVGMNVRPWDFEQGSTLHDTRSTNCASPRMESHVPKNGESQTGTASSPFYAHSANCDTLYSSERPVHVNVQDGAYVTQAGSAPGVSKGHNRDIQISVQNGSYVTHPASAYGIHDRPGTDAGVTSQQDGFVTNPFGIPLVSDKLSGRQDVSSGSEGTRIGSTERSGEDPGSSKRNVFLDLQYGPHTVVENALRGGGVPESPEPEVPRPTGVDTQFDATSGRSSPNDLCVPEFCRRCCGICRCLKDVKFATFPPSRTSRLSLDDDRLSETVAEFDVLTERCTRRITDLEQKINEVRREKQQLSQPETVVEVLVPPREVKSSGSSTDRSALRSKPPPSIWKSSGRAGLQVDELHELSTIIEVDTPQKTKDDSSQRSRSPETRGFEISNELIRRNIMRSPFKWMKEWEHPNVGVEDVLERGVRPFSAEQSLPAPSSPDRVSPQPQMSGVLDARCEDLPLQSFTVPGGSVKDQPENIPSQRFEVTSSSANLVQDNIPFQTSSVPIPSESDLQQNLPARTFTIPGITLEDTQQRESVAISVSGAEDLQSVHAPTFTVPSTSASDAQRDVPILTLTTAGSSGRDVQRDIPTQTFTTPGISDVQQDVSIHTSEVPGTAGVDVQIRSIPIQTCDSLCEPSNVELYQSMNRVSGLVSRLVRYREAQAAGNQNMHRIVQSTLEEVGAVSINPIQESLGEALYHSSEESVRVTSSSKVPTSTSGNAMSSCRCSPLPHVHRQQEDAFGASSADSPPEDLRTAFQNLGVGWANSMIRKTEETLARSSSSSEYSPRRQTSRLQPQWANWSWPSRDSTDNSHDESRLMRRLRDHSTPLVVSDSNGNKHPVMFTEESEISPVQNCSSIDFSDLSIRTPNISLRVKLSSTSHSSSASS